MVGAALPALAAAGGAAAPAAAGFTAAAPALAAGAASAVPAAAGAMGALGAGIPAATAAALPAAGAAGAGGLGALGAAAKGALVGSPTIGAASVPGFALPAAAQAAGALGMGSTAAGSLGAAATPGFASGALKAGGAFGSIPSTYSAGLSSSLGGTLGKMADNPMRTLQAGRMLAGGGQKQQQRAPMGTPGRPLQGFSNSIQNRLERMNNERAEAVRNRLGIADVDDVARGGEDGVSAVFNGRRSRRLGGGGRGRRIS